MSDIIPLHIIGGFGDVTIGRKLNFLLLNPLVSKNLGLISILDRYEDTDEIKMNPRDFLNKKVKPNFKTPVSEEVLDALADRIKTGSIRYYSSGKNREGIDDFFKRTNEGDIIDISTPNLTHIYYLERAARETRANITTEKPVVSSIKEINQARKIISEANKINPERIFVDQEHYSHYELIMHYVDNLDRNLANFGKIKKIKIELKEKEGFDSNRNRNIINKDISGGGIWLDLGPHVLSFLTSLGTSIDFKTISAIRHKYSDSRIAEDVYQETRMDVSFNANSSNYLNLGAKIEISVGKAADATQKIFKIEHENGYANIDIGNKTYSDSAGNLINLKNQEPFLNSYIDLIKAVKHEKKPRTPIEKSPDTLTNLFTIQEIAEKTPMRVYSNW